MPLPPGCAKATRDGIEFNVVSSADIIHAIVYQQVCAAHVFARDPASQL